MPKRVALLAVFAALVGVGVLAGGAPRALASSTVIDVADGEVFVRHVGVESAARDDQPLVEGDEVRTGDDGHAVVLFFDGSTLALEPSTTVRIDTARVADHATLVDVYQAVGTTWHAVHKILDAGSRYEVTTPAMTAAVRGTAFLVSVGDEDDHVATEEGTVEVTAQRQSVRVTPGLRTAVRHGATPRAPEQAPRPQRVLRVDLPNGAGAIVDRSRRAVGVAPDGSLRNGIPGARVERDGDVVRVFVPNPSRELRFVSGPGLNSVGYALLDASGRTLASGQATPGSGPLHEVFEQIRGTLPDATATPHLRTPAPALATPQLTSPLPTRTLTATPLATSALPTLPPPALTTLTPAPTTAPPTPAPTTFAPPPLAPPPLASPTLAPPSLAPATLAPATLATPTPTLAVPTVPPSSGILLP